MPLTYVNIASTTLASSQSNVSLSSIPQTYTDLMLVCSMRGNRQTNADPVNITLNNPFTGAGTEYSYTTLYGTQGSPTAVSGNNDSRIYTPEIIPQQFMTGNIFCNLSIYIPNYTTSQTKSLYLNGGFVRSSGATANVTSLSGLARTTLPVTSIHFSTNGLNADSTFYLYGIKNT
jgi:hypothetical protein